MYDFMLLHFFIYGINSLDGLYNNLVSVDLIPLNFTICIHVYT